MFTRFISHGTLNPQEVLLALRPICSWITFQTEVCPESGREHLQGYVVLKVRSRATTFARQFPSHVEPRRGTHTQAVQYCSKEETRKAGTQCYSEGTEPIARGTRTDLAEFRDAILAGASNWALLEQFPGELAKFPKFVHLVRNEQLSHNVLANLPVFQPRLGWQFELCQRIEGVPNPRIVLWRWESTGNVGKSYFALHYKPSETFVVTGGKHADIHYAYGYQKYVIFDFPRYNQESFPYGLVEQFKNGYFLSSKYESVAKRFPVPHVVVFTNFAPDVSQMSLDRWDIVEIE